MGWAREIGKERYNNLEVEGVALCHADAKERLSVYYKIGELGLLAIQKSVVMAIDIVTQV